MIRDFSLVFLLLISDRRNLHRDSRRDTEQNVPWLMCTDWMNAFMDKKWG